MMGGGLGGIFASVAFKSAESPKYTVNSAKSIVAIRTDFFSDRNIRHAWYISCKYSFDRLNGLSFLAPEQKSSFWNSED